MYVGDRSIERGWSEVKQESAEIRDLLYLMLWRMGAFREEVTEPPHVVRPKEIKTRLEAERKRRETKARLHAAEWKDVD